ncbi:MerR family redox-sensitive transcriptional activator SoxR [Kineococcus xinjiangensis]|uniref:MerR family redox-sensitive transcriptional activator SoxR n=1 Tax=Kineococcus xinjiangensis TaxID=512762 RepID=A0A2S6II07_9ACTN|nr:redox-sensitive transcriptional activator SoxR [Kineococcus xinjiangensis]PPK93816.1 MerR family redox-sensitive transcriptional activator SoxR [Kineococcus xinjiangensis]
MREDDGLSVGEVSARSGVAVSALHYYERRGLITSTRTVGNQRRYPRHVLRRLALLRVAQRLGLPLARVADAFATLPADRAPSRRDWERLSREWRADLDERIAALERLRDDVTGCIGCGCLSMRTCRVMNPADAAAGRGPGSSLLRGAED